MSALDWIALIGNLLATVSIVPHLVQAIRTRQPVGSLFGWCLSAVSAGLWLSYGLIARMPAIGAPGWVVVPVSTVLAIWVLAGARPAAEAEVLVEALTVVSEAEAITAVVETQAISAARPELAPPPERVQTSQQTFPGRTCVRLELISR